MNEHSTDDIRRKLAEFTGWRIETLNNPSGDYWGYAVYCNDRVKVPLKISSSTLPPSMSYIWKRAFKEADIPDWPNDVDAALTLCCKIASEPPYYILAFFPETPVLKTPPLGRWLVCLYDRMLWKEEGNHIRFWGEGETPAEALARLALAWYERENE